MTDITTTGTLDASGDKPAVRLERHLPDPPEVVWRAITDRAELKSWFPCDVIVEGCRWVVGATISFPFPADVIDMTLAGQVLEVDEPRLLSYTWGEAETLTFELFPHDGGTRLVLTDRLEPGWAARNAAGWDDCLDRLAGLPARPDAWKERFAVYSAAFEPQAGPQEGPPAGYKG
ncbi:MAG: SRPBCC domain-containing protein [Nocardiopsaceae bacterium]|nr:SRPBCC domain-containing protein [Nocardiopsaceae bacterium]